jgi:hypothetical protein
VANSKEEFRRKKAFEDFYMLPMLGIPRNPNQLYEWYIQRLHDNPDDRANIPTTNRATVYKWFKEDEWEKQALDREELTMDKAAKKYEDLRLKGIDNINLMITKATNALSELLESTDNKIRFQAAEAVLDRAGLTRAGGKDNRHTVGTPVQAERLDDAPIDKTETEMLAWLSDSNRDDTQHG